MDLVFDGEVAGDVEVADDFSVLVAHEAEDDAAAVGDSAGE